MSRDRRGNGIQEVVGSIPIGSTNPDYQPDADPMRVGVFDCFGRLAGAKALAAR
jgi:hypothetical protein